MNLPIEQIGLSGGTFISMLAALVGLWFKFMNKVENLERQDDKQQVQIDGINKWTHEHEKEAGQIREGLNKDISKLEGANLVVTEQFRQIISSLEEIKERMDRLENRR